MADAPLLIRAVLVLLGQRPFAGTRPSIIRQWLVLAHVVLASCAALSEEPHLNPDVAEVVSRLRPIVVAAAWVADQMDGELAWGPRRQQEAALLAGPDAPPPIDEMIDWAVEWETALRQLEALNEQGVADAGTLSQGPPSSWAPRSPPASSPLRRYRSQSLPLPPSSRRRLW
ncbi:hypothetical protein BOTBODRAFT_182030 [Botryobasidium botryosum FD-172 SS1]|uniref:Uncharacterized protein n=1 Tax=Botryobasidium botryosum (strain FD-172 SS1) TaxID=930990 RepID=A0A067M285_BOTB1|nr:hypothetical protein BOTBODRAFT_182030 [Botryobasidium botryosum FD-172 SS1]